MSTDHRIAKPSWRSLKGCMLSIGVTLLEIMLVLAIAAIVIVMSVRYYQSTNAASQANAFLSQLMAIQAAADSLGPSSFNYRMLPDELHSTLGAILGEKWNVTPWGDIMYAHMSSDSTIFLRLEQISKQVCQLVFAQLRYNHRWAIGLSATEYPLDAPNGYACKLAAETRRYGFSYFYLFLHL